MPQVTPFKGSNLTELALRNRQFGQRDREFAVQSEQNNRRLDQGDRQLAQGQQRIDAVAQQLGIDKEAAKQQIFAEAVANSKNPEQAAQLLELYGGVPVSQEGLDGLRKLDPALFGTALDKAPAQPADLQTFNARTQNLPPQDVELANRIALGLEPRAQGRAPQVVMIGGVPHEVDFETGATTPLNVGGAPVTPESVGASAGTVAAGEAAGKASIAASEESRKQLPAIQKGIANIDDAIRAIEIDGATTGAIASRLPSIRQASIGLENIRARMALDIVGATTFGALSKGELDLAKDVALPTGLGRPQLLEWLKDKKSAQEKYARELEGAAIFLGQPGNTPAKYLQFLRDNGALSFGPTPAQRHQSSGGISFTVEE